MWAATSPSATPMWRGSGDHADVAQHEGRRPVMTERRTERILILAAFPEEFQGHVAGYCPLRHDLVLSKMTDCVPGQGFRYDEIYQSKQPDWTYELP